MNKTEMNNDTLIYMIANGSGKGRGDKEQNVQKQRNWCLNMLTTGEDKITKDNSHGGSKVRCIEIENDGNIFDLSNITKIADTIRNNYGWAGRKFIYYIIETGKEKIVERYQKIRDNYMIKKPSLDGKQINAISLLRLADELTIECIFQDEQPISDEYLFSIVKDEQEISVAERAKDYVLNTISVNKSNFELKNSDEQSNYSFAKREFWGYITDNLCYVNKSTIDKILTEGNFSFSEVKRKWVTMGFINDYKGRYYYWNDTYKANFVQIIMPTSINKVEDDTPPF